ncbi:tyrosine-type recombinase/integrase [Paenibacillus lycopersici]|uniref:Tyrosine-type recombinase/integrase n=1 Tax=Paenibacillus lycopersici TaxID=2704462 RepID=A0A6C0FWX4_9BACL|nr:tyrosine-type recombinase/integrase [Paenibacillus lycopersici]QHT61227.1 tyrosine-type recombinase/integrase [Paenibacillus lycopersici]
MNRTVGISDHGARAIQDFIETLAIPEALTPKTLKEYASDLKQFIAWFETIDRRDAEDAFRIEAVTESAIVRYREAARQEMALKPATVNRRLITLKRFFGWAAAEWRISLDPAKAVKLVPETKASPRRMQEYEEAALIAAVEQGGSLRDLTILLVMLHAGLRTMEVCDLAPNDIRLGKRVSELTVRSAKGDKRREVPLNDVCSAALAAYLAASSEHSPYLFPSEKTGDRLTERALRHLVRKYMTAAGLEGLSAHDLRHRFGYAEAENMPLHRLARLMGHDRPETTMHYYKATPEEYRTEAGSSA